MFSAAIPVGAVRIVFSEEYFEIARIEVDLPVRPFHKGLQIFSGSGYGPNLSKLPVPSPKRKLILDENPITNLFG